uniref:Si:ch73-335m24.2 n=1 Tax=Callorhinchus milii TaxID=7868 RepID=A0A4W3H7D9_CALMI
MFIPFVLLRGKCTGQRMQNIRTIIQVLLQLFCLVVKGGANCSRDSSVICFHSPDYLLKVLQNHTVQACDGEQLPINCPPQSTISVLSAFYGRRIASQRLCPTAGNTTSESTNCMARTTVPKVFDECQEQRSCQLSVNSRVFGLDPCPGTTKYLIISYKCKPGEYESNARNGAKWLNIRFCTLFYQRFTHKIHGCTLCAAGGWYNGPRMSRLHAKDAIMIVSSSWATLAHIRGLPEKVALYFVSGVSIGLVLILCTFGFHMAVLRDIRKLCSEPDDDNQGSEDGLTKIRDDDDDDSSDTSFRQLTRQYRTSDNIFSPQVAAVMIERVEQKEQGDNEMWLNKESSPYAIPNHNQHSR